RRCGASTFRCTRGRPATMRKPACCRSRERPSPRRRPTMSTRPMTARGGRVNPAPYLVETPDIEAVPLWPVAQADYPGWLERQAPQVRTWLERTAYKPEAGAVAVIPGRDGEPAGAVLGLGEQPDMWAYGDLARKLGAGTYRIE